VATERQDVLGKDFPFSPIYECPSLNEEGRQAYHDEMLARELDAYFWRCFWLLYLNQVPGDYLEFGSGSTVSSFRLAHKHYRLRPEIPRRLFAFDSFEGLPAPAGVDEGPAWAQQRGMAVSLEQFIELLALHGIARDEYVVAPGFFEDTLSGKEPSDYGIERAAFVHIDCDYYESAKLALEFALPALSDGAILSFDDWFAFNGRPDHGEQRAFREVMAANKGTLSCCEWQTFRFHGKAFLVHRNNGGE
jgi:O-methyltransferase